jgi:hypothetical protein
MRESSFVSVRAPELSDELWAFIAAELRAIPFDYWGFFLPALVGSWRFVDAQHPGCLGAVDMSYRSDRTTPPSAFRITGSSYVVKRLFGASLAPDSTGPEVYGPATSVRAFSEAVMHEGAGFNAVEAIMYFVADGLSSELSRGKGLRPETPIPRPPTELLASLALTLMECVRLLRTAGHGSESSA